MNLPRLFARHGKFIVVTPIVYQIPSRSLRYGSITAPVRLNYCSHGTNIWFSVTKRHIKSYSPIYSTISRDDEEQLRSSGRVVWGAVLLNGANFMAKAFAWIYTGSHSMFAEAVHSLADTANQLILAVGIRKSLQSPTADHPYGYHPMRYIAPLISGVGIFCVGCGLSIYHGFEALMMNKPDLFVSPIWAYGILTFSFLSESTTLIMAVMTLREGAKKSSITIRDYIGQNRDPGVIVVLLEDFAAVLGIGIAATCMGLSSHYGTHIFDACGSVMIGSLLGAVASFIIKKNTIALVGKSIPQDTLNNINRIIEKDVLIRAIHDVKATDLGNGVVRYKAEVDVDGRELARKYLERVDLKGLLDEIREIKSEKDAEAFVLTHGEGVVDLLGAEVDRIEKELRRNHPKVKHVDLEVL
jgi:zinc transporter 9